MNAIAAAVIGGTSLFGGRGKTWSALLGVLVIVVDPARACTSSTWTPRSST